MFHLKLFLTISMLQETVIKSKPLILDRSKHSPWAFKWMPKVYELVSKIRFISTIGIQSKVVVPLDVFLCKSFTPLTPSVTSFSTDSSSLWLFQSMFSPWNATLLEITVAHCFFILFHQILTPLSTLQSSL